MTATTFPVPTDTVDTVDTVDTGADERSAGFVTTTLQLAGRSLRTFVRTPQLVVVGTLSSAMFLLIFRYVFGGAIDTGGVDYVHFLVPGFITTSILYSGSATAAAVAEDLEQGFVDRLRSLPVPRQAVLAGRALADTVNLTWGLVVMSAIGLAVGFRFGGSVAEALGALALLVVLGFAFTWVFIWMGLVSGSAQAAQGLSMAVFPLTFVSSSTVPVDTMPGWMQAFAEHQPVTVMVNAVRSLALGDPAAAGLGHTTAYWVVLSLAWAAGVVAVFAPLAARRFARA
jgi:ABC-2 type transport system permease protein